MCETSKRLIPRYARLPLILCAVTLILAYNATMLIDVTEFVDISTPADHMIGVRPVWVLVYVLSYVYWIIGYIAVSRVSRERCWRLVCADFAAKVIAAACFMLIPVTIERPELADGGFFEHALGVIYQLDAPRNLFPSMHCMYSWLAAREIISIKDCSPVWKWCAVLFSVLVFLSTLFTRQHYILDIFGGIAVAELGMLAARLVERCTKREV